MTGCEFEAISRLIDGELPAQEASQLREHLKACPACADAHDSLKDLDSLCREVFPRAEFKAPILPRRRFRWLPLAAALAVMVAAGLAYAAVEGLLFAPKVPPKPATPVVAPSAPHSEATGAHSAPSVPAASPEPAPVASVPANGRSFSGTVRNFDDEPLTEARIVAVDERGVLATGSVDAEGRFTCDWPKGTMGFTIAAPGYKNAFVYVDGAPDSGNGSADVRLFRAVPVKGRVMDERGAGIAGVSIAEVGEDLKPGELRPAGPVFSDANGDFVLPSAGDYTFTHPAYSRVTVDADEDTPLEPVVLPAGGALRIQAVREGGPAAGVDVCIRSSDGEPRWSQTGPDGSVLIESIPAGECSISGGHPETRQGAATIVPGAVAEFRMEMPPSAGVLRGKVIAATGEPVFGLFVRLERSVPPNNPRKTDIGILTNTDGTFELPLEPGGGRVSLGEHTVQRVLERHLDWKAPQPSTWTVTPNADGAPVELEIIFGANEAPSTRKLILLDKQGETITTPALMLEPGYGSPTVPFIGLEAPGGELVVSLGAQYLWAYDPVHSALGFALFDYRIQKDLPIHCTIPATYLRGRVVDREGKALPHARVGAFLNQQKYANCGIYLEVETNRDGRFTLGPVIAGDSYRMDVSAQGYDRPPDALSPTVVAGGATEITIPLWAEDAVVEGTVVDADGASVAEARIEVQSASGRSWTQRVLGGAFHWNVVPGPVTFTVAVDLGKRKVSSEPLTVTAPAKDILLQVPFTRQRPEGGDPGVEAVQEVLRQLGLTFKLAAGENKGAYPSIGQSNGQLVLDLSEIPDELLPDPELLKRFESGNYCYLGYVVNDEASGQAFLDWYEQNGPSAADDQHIEVPQGAGNGGSDQIQRLKEGVERFLITDINDPNSAARIQASIPVLWELPGNHADPGGSVLFMDGHVEWISYPGPFPMTPSFIERVTALSGRPKASP